MFTTEVAKTFAMSLHGEAALRPGPKKLLSCVVAMRSHSTNPWGKKRCLRSTWIAEEGIKQRSPTTWYCRMKSWLKRSDCNAMDLLVTRP